MAERVWDILEERKVCKIFQKDGFSSSFEHAIYIRSVERGSPAELAGVLKDDQVMYGVNG